MMPSAKKANGPRQTETGSSRTLCSLWLLGRVRGGLTLACPSPFGRRLLESIEAPSDGAGRIGEVRGPRGGVGGREVGSTR